MGLFDRLRAAPRRERGRPASSNGASSLHLSWTLPTGLEIIEVAATLTIVEPPAVDHLYFWALQASFADGTGQHGGAHLGLQWHPQHPGGTAVNFGGYRRGGGELEGTVSSLPSARGNPNTRDFTWEPGRPYRLSIARVEPGRWSGAVDGVPFRELHCPGDRLAGVMTWSEVFAPCNAPSVVVRWEGWEATLVGGEQLHADRLGVNYQSFANGGCTNTTARVTDDGVGVLQITSTARETPQGAVLRVSPE